MAIESTQTSTVLDQMNQILDEKEAIIDEKQKKLELYQKELKLFENQLVSKTNDLKKEQLRIEEEHRKLEKRIKEENEKIDMRWSELHEYEANAQNSMEKILQEKLKLEEQSKEKLKEELDEYSFISSSENDFNLEALRSSVGLSNDSSTVSTTMEAEEDAVKSKKEDLPKVEEKKVDEATADEIPKFFRMLEKEITKNYPKWNMIEILPERYCLEVSSRPSKEIRFFITEGGARVDVVMQRKNAKNDRKAQNDVISLARVEPDWNITTEDNSIVCGFDFPINTEVSFVLKKCNDFIKTHL